MKKIKINNRYISEKNSPYIIAELSANHCGSLVKAKKIIRKISKTGVDAVKLQTFTPNSMTLNLRKKDFLIRDKQSPWNGYSLYSLYEKAQTHFSWHKILFNEAKKNNLTIFSSVFDTISLNFLEDLNVPAYKIASFENNHFPLIHEVLKKNKPTLISLGASNKSEINHLKKMLLKSSNKKVVLLKCTSTYPASNADLNLKGISLIRQQGHLAGYSDHTKDNVASISATALGACIIEKHVKDDDDIETLDSKFSLPVSKLANFVNDVRKSWLSLGKKTLLSSKNEKNSRIFKRSIYVSKDIKKNEKFTTDNIKIIRPGFSLDTRYYDLILKSKSNLNLEKGSRLRLSCLKKK